MNAVAIDPLIPAAKEPPSVTSPAKVKYRPDVDGLRAVAVLSVLLFHGGLKFLSGGYVGVDVFFVISGFVITTKLAEEIDERKFSIANFYVRRIRRIMPALAAMIIGTYVAALIFFLPNAMLDFSKSLVATALFISNMYFWKNSGYFETSAHDRPLLHTWSLSIEEQFYIVIPIALFLVMRYARRLTFPLMALGAIASLALSIYVTDKAPTANFFVLPTRAWELLLGSLVALAPWPPVANRWLREALAVLGLGLILYAVVFYTEATPFPGVSALAPTVGTALLIYIGKQGGMTAIARGLAQKPVVWVGLISYSLYLAHWPVIVFARYALLRDLQGWEVGAVVAASFLLAWLSYRFVETPFRHPHHATSRLKLFGVAGALLVGIAALGAVGVATKGFAMLHPDFQAPKSAETTGPDTWMTGRCFLENQDASAWAGDACVRTHGAAKNAILWGDSFAAHYVPGLLANQDRLDRNIVQYTFAGCPPILSYTSYARPGCQGFNQKIFDVAQRYQADTVVISTRWDQLRQRGLDGLADTVRQLKARGLTVYVIGQSPMFPFDVTVLDYRKAGRAADGQTAAWYPTMDERDNARIRAQSGGATFVDPMPAFCQGERCGYRRPEGLLFYDYGHLSDAGSNLAVRSYFPLYRR